MTSFFRELLQDLQYAIRQLRRAPAFAVIAIATLGLTIAVSTAVFSVLDATVIRPLPYGEADRIVALNTYSPQGYTQPASWPQYMDWQGNNSTFSALAGVDSGTTALSAARQRGGVQTVHATYGTANLFDVFGVKPIMGRTFLPGEDHAGKNDVAVLSYALWKANLNGDPKIVGAVISLDGIPTTIIGVMPAGFRYPLTWVKSIYRPLRLTEEQRTDRGTHFLPTIGRLKPGVTTTQAQTDLNRIFRNLDRAYPNDAGGRAEVLPLATFLLGSTVAPLRALTCAVAGILLIGCVNLGALLLARGIRRQREFALRVSMGSSKSRLLRQMFTEVSVLSLMGAATGVCLAAVLLQVIRQLLIASLARGAEVKLSIPILLVAAGTSLLTGIFAGMLPALRSARTPPALVLRSGSAAGNSRRENNLRASLIICQIAVTLSLLIASGIILSTLRRLESADLGFPADRLLTEELDIPLGGYSQRDVLTGFYNPLLERVRGLPGVAAAGAINMLPIQQYGSNADIHIVGQPPDPPHVERLAEFRTVLPGTLEAFGGALLAGRRLDPSLDRNAASPNVLVNQAFVKKFLRPGDDPLAQQIDVGGGMKIAIVGVVSDVRQALSRPPMAEMDQLPPSDAASLNAQLSQTYLILRTTPGVTPDSLIDPLRNAMRAVDPSVPFSQPMTMDDVVEEALVFQRLESWLFGIFAGLAFLLSLVGVYGMVHHEVALRTRDIGVHMALGSSRGAVFRSIVGRIAKLMILGVTAGWLVTLALQQMVQSFIPLHVRSNGGLLFLLTFFLIACGVTASFLPARRAALIQPNEALRSE